MARAPGILPTGGIRYFRKFLFDTTVAETDWSLGMVRDRPRNQIPPGGAYDLLDFFTNRPGMLYKRGGTSYQSNSLNSHTDVDIVGMACVNFPGDPRVIAITSDGSTGRYAYDVSTASAGVALNVNSAQPTENLSLYKDRMILTSGTVFYVPQKFYLSGGAVQVASLLGSPPVGIVSCNHAGRFVIGHSSAYPGRFWFSDALDIENTWDTTNAWFDISNEPIMGLASVNGVLLVWTRSRLLRVTGSIPPGVTNSDMVVQPFANIGCIDARTIVEADNVVYFANESGVYSTDGSKITNLTNKETGKSIGDGISSRSFTTTGREASSSATCRRRRGREPRSKPGRRCTPRATLPQPSFTSAPPTRPNGLHPERRKCQECGIQRRLTRMTLTEPQSPPSTRLDPSQMQSV